ncbi:nicotinate-nucleotide adenylyltransferase [Peribacillus tepidiphilus]|jgi:nicotinate-nucleotide adenylyltransferase|uniref:nicotinate-nucleotide adenylyltransferase n=1 Tax=Peribacillus tepidiphilus TaxID=2652445 RepID=UPI001291942E|nr:nicotinate-nucleotide adenylyltransferase [Peribacillus tepidiphilus]
MKKRVGILGGTFDPPHVGHLIIANEVFHALCLDEVRFMPNRVPPHKEKKSGTSIEDRIEMIKRSISDHDHFKLETIEIEREGPSYTFDTIQLLKKQEPNHEFFFIIGADMIEYLPKWYRIDELMKIIQFVGVKRPPYNEKTSYNVKLIDSPEIFLSSSILRERIRKGISCKYLVHDKVLDYIEKNRLYRT